MVLHEGHLRFDFATAIDAFKFDEQDPALPMFHGLSHCMKAVDFVVEYPDHYLFVEVKDPGDPTRYGPEMEEVDLIKGLVGKFRDSFLYRWSEGKVDKPVRYQCLVEIDHAQTLHLMDELKRQLPVVKIPRRWKRPVAGSCAVANRAAWNAAFADILVTRT